MSRDSARRRILCPRCERLQEVARSTKSTSCPGCNRNISTQDLEIDEYCARIELYTAGCVTVGRKGTLIAEVRVEGLVVKGEVKGPVRARERVAIEKGGRIFGNVTCPALAVAEGGQLVGMVVTGPGAGALMAELEAATTPARAAS